MKLNKTWIGLALGLASVLPGTAAVLHVPAEFTTIQDAVDAAQPGDLVLVADGVYTTGGRAVTEGESNRVAIDKAISVQSVNGPAVTVIEGAPANAGGGVRCVYLGGDAELRGFTLTNGYAPSSGGGVSGGTLYNCIITGNEAYYSGGGSAGGTFHNCIITGNSAWYSGGGVYGSTLYNCILTGNSVTGNYEDYFYYGGGGGADGGTLHNCAITGNSAPSGGGVREATLYNCTVTGNSAGVNGGGVLASTLYNCIVYFNDALSGPNHAGVYKDYKFDREYVPVTFYSSCTTPLPLYGEGNIVADPHLITLTHLSDSSPCIGAGSSDYTSGVDIDGEPWADPPCMGADQLTPDAVSGALTMAIRAEYLNIATDFRVKFSADNQGPIVASAWDFDDGTVVSNAPLASHSWNAPGLYTVRLSGYNDSFPDGVTTTVQIEVTDADVHYVNQNNPTPQFPYTSWATAATNIQTAIETGNTVGRRILVTNGVYTSGAVLARGWSNRIALLDPVVVRSVNGPEVTVIDGVTGPEGANGEGAIRCAYVGANAILSGFTLTRGEASNGGGAWCEHSATLTNCVLTDNWARDAGGGAYGGTLRSCVLTRNSAAFGGGASDSTLHNCILTDNTASFGGGADGGFLRNCTLTFNTATKAGGGLNGGTHYNCIVYFNTIELNPNTPGGANYAARWTVGACGDFFGCDPLGIVPISLFHSCTFPLPVEGTGNITNVPLFADAAAGDFRLRYGSPGIDAAADLSAILIADLDGRPRPLDGDGDGNAAFDMGAFELDLRSLIAPDWFTGHGLDATDPLVLSGNPDHDALTTFQEWLAATDPTDDRSFFRIDVLNANSPVSVSFPSATDRAYTLWSASQFAPPDWIRVPGQQEIPGTGGTLTLIDESFSPRQFYRVEVSLPR